MKSCNLPVVREAADVKLQCALIMIDLFETFAREVRDKKETELAKPEIIKVIIEIENNIHVSNLRERNRVKDRTMVSAFNMSVGQSFPI
jgi:hypothetical protein